MMRQFSWEKLGKIFEVNGEYEWMNSHTTPVAAIVIGDIIRVYFSTRSKIDQNNNFISNTTFLDVDIDNPKQIKYLHNKPLFELGQPGTFDEFGIMVTDVVKFGDKIYLYYAGWQRLGGGTASYQVMLGLGISDDGGYTFRKYSDGPIMGIDTYDPISVGNVAVIKDDKIWRLYYTSLTQWFLTGNKPTYEYVIKYAESDDGISWAKTGKTIIGIENGFGVATPAVVKLKDDYHMWFGYRKAYDNKLNIGGYAIGYAYSLNGIDWIRKDSNSNLITSLDGWDSKMICYPNIVKTNSKVYLFYCGNNFGSGGFGVAELL